ncbi:Soluble calcium-activated nucleotidase 1 [Hypsibius exemplaris]|uniref:Metalloendopeptidase n=1 Tax=Hypsibius exemplaris TaxID=2072580 RepID=A0A1W0WGQ7_HYPEX|nr:Soluble calcium-activated nucleotidase 1 [Hypsibius exemplaris]
MPACGVPLAHQLVLTSSVVLLLLLTESQSLDTSKLLRTFNLNQAYGKWNKKGIPYYLDPAFTTTEKEMVKLAINTIQSALPPQCITFIEVPETDPQYKVKFTPLAGTPGTPERNFCYSYPGMNKASPSTTEQVVSIARGPTGCLQTSCQVQKYLAILLGKRNEHQRGDRDKYITVNSNLAVAAAYTKYSTTEAYWSLFPYDYCSITHNQPSDFAAPGTDAFTVVPGNVVTKMPTVCGLSLIDCKGISMMYGCESSQCGQLPCVAQAALAPAQPEQPVVPPPTTPPPPPPTTTPPVNTANPGYPFTKPVKQADGWVKYRIAIICDQDKASKFTSASGTTWFSVFKTGSLLYNVQQQAAKVEWDPILPTDVTFLQTLWNFAGRGNELSELTVFNGKMYAPDDKTGIVSHIGLNPLQFEFPIAILGDGDGKTQRGFKAEWSTIKDGAMIMGSIGSMFIDTVTGKVLDGDRMWIKKIYPDGHVVSEDWTNNYRAVQKNMGISYSGYINVEAAGWSDELKKWVFLPRRASNIVYNDSTESLMGTNHMVICNENFTQFTDIIVGDKVPAEGFSSMKFVPETGGNVIVALKSSEDASSKFATFIMVFDITGKIILPKTLVLNDFKFEGLEFI